MARYSKQKIYQTFIPRYIRADTGYKKEGRLQRQRTAGDTYNEESYFTENLNQFLPVTRPTAYTAGQFGQLVIFTSSDDVVLLRRLGRLRCVKNVA